MKEQLASVVKDALQKIAPDTCQNIDVQIEIPKDPSHGDYATNVAMSLAKILKKAPKKIAEEIVEICKENPLLEDVSIAGPGFINFTLANDTIRKVVDDIYQAGSKYGASNLGQNKKIQIEFVSANPTGPLHVGHGRHAAFGSSLSNILSFSGYDVHKEYYVNDAGRQMDILAVSLLLRCLELQGEKITLPSAAYQGDYIIDIARLAMEDNDFNVSLNKLFVDVPAEDVKETQDAFVDAVIKNAKHLLGEQYAVIHQFALNNILSDIKSDLAEFGVIYEEWFSEKLLVDDVKAGIEELTRRGFTYTKDGALWFKATEFGDDKDRVLMRKNGQTTYFASDVAYHYNKIQRGFSYIIDVFGSDHHGYVARIHALLSALGLDPSHVHIDLMQFVKLYRGKELLPMSTRKGQFVTLRDLRKEVGNDAARFFYVMRSCDQPIDFDLELAKSKSNENPVHYVQYAHARICSVFNKEVAPKEVAPLTSLTDPHEKAVMLVLMKFPSCVLRAAETYQPHIIANYLRELANSFHSYYNAQKILVENEELKLARLSLSKAVQQVLKNGLSLLGVGAPEAM